MNQPSKFINKGLTAGLAAIGIALGAVGLAPAGAQVNTGDPNVIVGLCVFEDAGYGAALTPPPPPKMAETAAKTKKTPAARPGGEPKAREKAELPPAGTPLAPGRAMQIVFKSRASKLPDTAKAGLKTMAAKLKGQPALRLHLMAYAGGESLSSGKARRLSLARARSVRSYLIESGVRSTRIDVRALGNQTAEEPLNRVDVTIAER